VYSVSICLDLHQLEDLVHQRENVCGTCVM
jgi:hypothetical protein